MCTVVASLPFEEKMRVAAPKRNRMNQDESRVVVRTKKEKKTDELLENLELLKEQKLKKEEEKKKQRFLKFSKEKTKEEERVKQKKKQDLCFFKSFLIRNEVSSRRSENKTFSRMLVTKRNQKWQTIKKKKVCFMIFVPLFASKALENKRLSNKSNLSMKRTHQTTRKLCAIAHKRAGSNSFARNCTITRKFVSSMIGQTITEWFVLSKTNRSKN
jgi:hypothetical protein